jgi:kynurenine formamidase
MVKLVDLSQPITHRGPARPFHPTPTIWTHVSHEDTRARAEFGDISFATRGLILSDHTSTHVDAFCHYDPRPEAESIDELPLEMFHTEGICLDFSHVGPGEDITPAHIDAELARTGLGIQRGDTFLYYTGHYEKNFGRPEWWSAFPGLGREATEYLADLGVLNIGTEAFTIDNPSQARLDANPPYPSHVVCRERRLLNMENMVIPRSLVGKRFKFIGFPLKIERGTASPIRAVAVLEDEA